MQPYITPLLNEMLIFKRAIFGTNLSKILHTIPFQFGQNCIQGVPQICENLSNVCQAEVGKTKEILDDYEKKVKTASCQVFKFSGGMKNRKIVKKLLRENLG